MHCSACAHQWMPQGGSRKCPECGENSGVTSRRIKASRPKGSGRQRPSSRSKTRPRTLAERPQVVGASIAALGSLLLLFVGPQLAGFLEVTLESLNGTGREVTESTWRLGVLGWLPWAWLIFGAGCVLHGWGGLGAPKDQRSRIIDLVSGVLLILSALILGISSVVASRVWTAMASGGPLLDPDKFMPFISRAYVVSQAGFTCFFASQLLLVWSAVRSGAGVPTGSSKRGFQLLVVAPVALVFLVLLFNWYFHGPVLHWGFTPKTLRHSSWSHVTSILATCKLVVLGVFVLGVGRLIAAGTTRF